MSRAPPFCENCGRRVADEKATITLNKETVAKFRDLGLLCRSRFRKTGHFNPKGVVALNLGLERLATLNGIALPPRPPSHREALEALVAACGKLRAPGGSYGPRQAKAAMADFNAFVDAYSAAKGALEAEA